MNANTNTNETDPKIVLGGVKKLLAKNTAERNDLSWELHYKDIKLRASNEGHIATLGRLAKYEDGIVEEALQFAKTVGMFISCDSDRLGLKTVIKDYKTKAGKVFKAHFTIYDSYLGKCSDKEWGDEPKNYNGNFLYKTYETEFAKWKKPIQPQSFQKLDDLFDFVVKPECYQCGDKCPLIPVKIGGNDRLICAPCEEEIFKKPEPVPEPVPEPKPEPVKKARGRPKKDTNAEPKPKKTSTKKPTFVKVDAPSDTECGIRYGKIYIPLCMMGAIGKGGLLIAPPNASIHYYPIPEKMDLFFFESIAHRFKNMPLADYHSCSLQNNIIRPNIDKICADCGITSQTVRNRVLDDTWVFLNSWFEQKDEDEDDEEEEDYLIPNKQTFLLDGDVEY
jgi:hypothetical protein